MKKITSHHILASLLLAFVLFLSVCASLESSREALAFDPPVVWTYSKGTSTPQAGVLIKSGAGVFAGGVGWNASGGTAFFYVFDSTSQPSTGTAPIWGSGSCGSGTFCAMIVAPTGGITFSTGLYAAFSSTGPTYTQAAGSSTGFYSIIYK